MNNTINSITLKNIKFIDENILYKIMTYIGIICTSENYLDIYHDLTEDKVNKPITLSMIFEILNSNEIFALSKIICNRDECLEIAINIVAYLLNKYNTDLRLFDILKLSKTLYTKFRGLFHKSPGVCFNDIEFLLNEVIEMDKDLMPPNRENIKELQYYSLFTCIHNLVWMISGAGMQSLESITHDSLTVARHHHDFLVTFKQANINHNILINFIRERK